MRPEEIKGPHKGRRERSLAWAQDFLTLNRLGDKKESTNETEKEWPVRMEGNQGSVLEGKLE